MRLSHPIALTPESSTTYIGSHDEQLTISVLEDDLINIRLYPDGKPRLDRTWMIVGRDGDVPQAGRQRDDLSPFSCPEYETTQRDNTVEITTHDLKIELNLSEARLTWSTRGGKVFAADTVHRAYAYDRTGRSVFHYMERRSDEHYYGFGERAGALDKRGMRMTMKNLDALGYDAETGDPLYKHFPFYITFIPELNVAYGLLYDNLATSTFDMGKEVDAYYGSYRAYQAEDGDLDYYLIYGPSVQDVVQKLTKLIGKMTLPPKWSLGYLGSTMLYTEAPDAQEQLKQFVELCQQHDIPCDLFHLSSGYTTGESDGLRYTFNWNHQRVPDPQGMVDHFHQHGIRLAANIKPYFLTTHPLYQEMKAQGLFITDPDTGEPILSILWSGGAFESAQGAYIDFTNPKAYAWWQAHVKSALLDYGIDSTWNDNNEYQIWDDAAVCHGFGEPLPLGLMRPIQTLLMNRASFEAQRAANPDLRPFVLSRSGCPGIQRYAQTWTGDNFTAWKTLRYNIPMGLGMSLSGAPNTGHDVGGFYGEKPEPELFLRWVQAGIFMPRFTIHSFNTDGTVNEPWMYPEILPLIREAIHFRYRLMPYLYTLFFETRMTGHPIIRPLVYDFQQDTRCHMESFQFMLGDQLMVAPVMEAGTTIREVYLPSGKNWYDFYTGDSYKGGQSVFIAAPLERIPLLVPEGGMIPMGKVMQHIGAAPDDLRQVYVFPPKAEGDVHFLLMEDDGVSMSYEKGEFTWVSIQVQTTTDSIAINLLQAGNFNLPYTEIEIIFPPQEDRTLQAKGEVYQDDEGRRRLIIKV